MAFSGTWRILFMEAYDTQKSLRMIQSTNEAHERMDLAQSYYTSTDLRLYVSSVFESLYKVL